MISLPVFPQFLTLVRITNGKIWDFGVSITLRIGPFQICIEKILDLGQKVLIISVTFINRMKRLNIYTVHPKTCNSEHKQRTKRTTLVSSTPMIKHQMGTIPHVETECRKTYVYIERDIYVCIHVNTYI